MLGTLFADGSATLSAVVLSLDNTELFFANEAVSYLRVNPFRSLGLLESLYPLVVNLIL